MWDDASADVSKLLLATGLHNNGTDSPGDNQNLTGIRIWHPILLDSPYDEPSRMDQLSCCLRNIHKVVSRTSHVYLWDLLLGARTSDSQDTPTFLQWHVVKKAVIS